MPVVRTYGTRRVGTAALPGVRRTAAETELSRGAGLERARAETAQTLGAVGGAVARQAGGIFARLQAEEVQRADETALLEAENRLATWENQRLYDPQTGALAVKGKAAMPLPEEVGAEFEQVSGDIAASLSTDRQRRAFARQRANRAVALDSTLRRHVFGEIQTYEAGELKAFVENATSSAINNATDPRRVGEELGKMTAAIQKHGPRAGLGPEAIEAAVGAAQSQVHVGVINRLLATNQDRAAKAYFGEDEVRAQISGDAIARVEKALEEGSLRGEAQRQVDRILLEGGTITEQRAKANTLDDPRLKDEVKQRLEHENAIQERAERELLEQQMRDGYDLIDRTGSVDAIGPAVWANYSGGTRSAMRSYAMSLAKGQPVETDYQTYYALLEQAADDPSTFTGQNLLNYKHKLGDTEFKQVVGLQLSLRTGDREAASRVTDDYRTEAQVIDNSLIQAGIDPRATIEGERNPAAPAVAFLRQRVGEMANRLQQQTGRKATNTDIQGFVDSIMSQSVDVPGAWLAFLPGGRSFTDVKKSLIELTPADIPALDRKEIDRVLRENGWPVTDAAALTLYMRAQARQRSR
jgi:hypothetical protein